MQHNCLHKSWSEPLKLLLPAMGSRPGSAWLRARFSSAPNRCSAWLRTRFSARDTGLGSIWLVARLGLLEARLSWRLGASQLGSARLAIRDAAHLGSWLGLGLGLSWGLGDQLNALLGSARSSARGSARGSARDWLGNRDSVWLGSGLSWAHLSRLGAWDRLGARLDLEVRSGSRFDQHPLVSPIPFSKFHPCGAHALFSPNILHFSKKIF